MSHIKDKKIGFIGLGSMGKPMAINIAKAKFPITVHDIREEPLAEMKKLGAKIAKNAEEVGRESDTVVVMVLTYPQVKEVVLPPAGVLSGMRSGSTLIITSTISPLDVAEVEKVARQSGVAVIDSPVSGGRIGAEDGTLALMVGADQKVFEDNEEVLKAMGKNIYHVGKVGQGETVKMINQILVAAHQIATAEALVMAKKLGVDLQVLVDVISNSVGDSRIWRLLAPRMIVGDFEAKGAINTMSKDTRLIMDTGVALGVPLLCTSLTYQIFQWAESRGLGKQDITSLITMFEEYAGVKVSEG
ncbi:MAG: NAD(P)-dependent oxidoreductase [Dehalococcoidales bacterium]